MLLTVYFSQIANDGTTGIKITVVVIVGSSKRSKDSEYRSPSIVCSEGECQCICIKV